MNVAKYIAMKLVTDDTIAEVILFSPILTALTERGWSFLKKPCRTSFSMTRILSILTEPEVEATQPPTKSIENRIILLNVGHVL